MNALMPDFIHKDHGNSLFFKGLSLKIKQSFLAESPERFTVLSQLILRQQLHLSPLLNVDIIFH